MRLPGWLKAFFSLPAVLASEVGYTGRTVHLKRLAPNPLIYPVPAALPVVFFWGGAVFFCEDNFWVLARGAGIQNAGLDVHDTAPASGSADVLGYEVSPAKVERAIGCHVFVLSHGRSLRAVALAVEQWSSSVVTSLFWRSAIVGFSQFLTPASSSRGRLIWSLESRGQLCVWSEEHLVEYQVFSLTSASVRMHRQSASHLGSLRMPRAGLGGWSSLRTGKVRSIRARSRALRSIALEAGLECSSSDEDVMSLAQR